MTLKELIEEVIKQGGTLDDIVVIEHHCNDPFYDFRKTIGTDWFDGVNVEHDDFSTTIVIHV